MDEKIKDLVGNTNNEPKIRFNIKQSVKGIKTYDITVRADTIEDIKNLFKSAEDHAMSLGCIREVE